MKVLLFSKTLLCFLVMFYTSASFAQNLACNAVNNVLELSLRTSETFSFRNVAATTSQQTNQSRHRWLQLEISTEENYHIDLYNNSNQNSQYDLYYSESNPCENGLILIRNVNNSNRRASDSFDLAPGLYYIRAYTNTNSTNANFNMVVTPSGRSNSNGCESAIVIPVDGQTYYHSNLMSTNISTTACNNNAYKGVWMSFTVPTSGYFTISTFASAQTNNAYQLFVDNCESISQVDNCIHNGGISTNMARETHAMQPGATAYLYLYRESGNDGIFGISIEALSTNSYCIPTSRPSNSNHISAFSILGTLNDIHNTSTFSTTPNRGFQDFTHLPNKAIQAQGQGINIIARSTGNSDTNQWKCWVDWNKNGTFDDNELVYSSGSLVTRNANFGIIIPENQAPGDYRIRIRSINLGLFQSLSACNSFTASNSGETEDYLFTVIKKCNANITSVTHGNICGPGRVVLQATATPQTTKFYWYDDEFSSTPIATTESGVWETPELNTTKTFYVTAANNSCESNIKIPIKANISNIPVIHFTPESPTICGENIVITLNASGDTETVYLIDEDFEGSGMGVFSQVSIDNHTNFTPSTHWSNNTSPIIPDGALWKPAIASGLTGNKFALAYLNLSSGLNNSVINSLRLRNNVNSTNFQDLTLNFRVFYSRYQPDNDLTHLEYFGVEVSTDAGNTWTSVQQYYRDLGIGTKFEDISLDLSSYINQNRLRIRFVHYGYSSQSFFTVSGVAIDDVKLYGTRPLNTAFVWNNNSEVDAYLDAGCTIPYTTGEKASTIYIKPTINQLNQELFSFQVSTLLNNGCTANNTIQIINKTKIWKGVDDNWNNPLNWTGNTVPTIEDCIIVPAQLNQPILANNNGYGKSIHIKNDATLVVDNLRSLTINDEIQIDNTGELTIKSGSSLLQITDIQNTSTIKIERSGNLRRQDYIYWSSPVKDFNIGDISPNTPASVIWQWNPTIQNNNNSWGNWVNFSGIMQPGNGYIVRGATGTDNTIPTNILVQFEGKPFNGTIETPVQRGNYTGVEYTGPNGSIITKFDDNLNLIGNPYPSAISADAFLDANPNLEGSVRIWTHGSTPSTTVTSPFYDQFIYNYSINDYIIYNRSGTLNGPHSFDGNIASGQGFFVIMKDGNQTSESVVFNNNMRIENKNNQFFRENTAEDSTKRIWVDVVSPTVKSARTLIAYALGATDGYETTFDAYAKLEGALSIYTKIDNHFNSCIQGRPLPIRHDDVVPIGLQITESGIHHIAIGALSSNMDQSIYLKDKLNNIYHLLNERPYSFEASAGTIDDRFELTFRNTSTALDISEYDSKLNVYWYKDTNNVVTFNSENEPLESITVYDLAGRKILFINNIDNQKHKIENQLSEQTYIAKIILKSKDELTFKIIQ